MRPMPSLIPRFNMDYRFSDLIYGMKAIFSGNHFDLKPLESLFGKKKFLFTNYGRSSLYLILRALNLPKGAKIGVPLYSCTVVFDAIVNAGLVPRFIDINIDTYTMDPMDLRDKIEDVSAVVVIHTFGHPADMDKIREIAKDVPIIEDCAHSLLSEYKGKKTGTLGDASFFSLAKYISAGDGGMIILNNGFKNFENSLNREISSLDDPSNFKELAHSIFMYMYSFLYHRPWFGMFAFHMGSFVERKVDIARKRVFRVSKIGRSNLSVFLRKLKTFKEKVERQRRNSKILLEELKDTNLKLPYERKNTWCNYFLFPILFESEDERDYVYKYLRKAGVDSAKLYSTTPYVAKKIYGYEGDCPNTEEFASRVMTIPNHYTLTKSELIKIANIIKKIMLR